MEPRSSFFYTKKGGSKISRRCPLEKGTSFSFPWAGCNYNDTGTVADIRGRSPPIRSPRSTFPATAGNNCSRNIPVGTYLICCCSADPANSVAHPKTISFRLGSRFEPILIRIPASGKTNNSLKKSLLSYRFCLLRKQIVLHFFSYFEPSVVKMYHQK